MGGWGCHGTIGARLHRRPDQAPIAPSGPDRAPIAPSGPDRAPIAPSGPDRARIAPSCPDQGEIALSLVALLYGGKDGPGASARILGGCGAVGDIARAYFLRRVPLLK